MVQNICSPVVNRRVSNVSIHLLRYCGAMFKRNPMNCNRPSRLLDEDAVAARHEQRTFRSEDAARGLPSSLQEDGSRRGREEHTSGDQSRPSEFVPPHPACHGLLWPTVALQRAQVAGRGFGFLDVLWRLCVFSYSLVTSH